MEWTKCTEVKPGWCDLQHMMEDQMKLLEKLSAAEQALSVAKNRIEHLENKLNEQNKSK